MHHASLVVQRADERRSFVTREIAGETLIVPVTGQAMDLESIFVLNPVGSRIWDLLRSPTTVDRIPTPSPANFPSLRNTRPRMSGSFWMRSARAA